MTANETLAYGMSVFLLLSVGLGLLFSKQIKRRYTDWYLFATVKKLGNGILQNIILTDGMDGTVCIDNLVLMADGILVVSVGRYQGAVFASEKIDLWTQVVGKRSYKFNNPLLKLEQDIAAVKANFPKINISGILVFSTCVSFPKGKPDNVISVTEAKQRFADVPAQGTRVAEQDAWDKLRNNILSET